jgi:hypothetical protein
MEPNQEILIDYLDQQLSPEISSRIANRVKENKETATELQYLKLAIDTVHQDAIRQQVSMVRRSFENDQTISVKKTNGILRTMYRTSLRIAAVFVFLAGIAILYKYITVDRQSVYEKQFTGYELSNTRGQADTDAISNAFQNKNWIEVTKIYSNESAPSNKSGYLAAMAEMQQNHFPQAVAIFENLLNTNRKTGDNSFQEETEYYLSLAYLMNHEVNKSVQLIHKIKADTSNTYYPIVSRISSIDLKIIELKK